MKFILDDRIRFFLDFKRNRAYKLGWTQKNGDNYFNGRPAVCEDCIHSYEWEYGVVGCKLNYTGDAVGTPRYANGKAPAKFKKCFSGRKV